MKQKKSFPYCTLAGQNSSKSDGNGLLLHQRKYSIKEASKLAGTGETTMRRIIQNGEIRVLMIGGKIQILEKDLEAFLQGNYGPIRQDAPEKPKVIPLPSHIQESDLLNPRSKSA